jgi:hypothetical protein
MNNQDGNKRLEALIELNKEEINVEKTAAELREIRELARAEKDPALVKICRLIYEYLEENEDFDLGYVEEEEIGDMTDLEYLLQLMIKSNLEVNREEIREYRNRLTEELY